MDRLEGGDDYDRKIQKNIARCSYFIPVVSATTERRLEAYFRREWSYALDRTRNMADDAIFILPVCIDATDPRAARVPDKFKAVHITQLAGRRGHARVRPPPRGAALRAAAATGARLERARARGDGRRRSRAVDAQHPWLGLASFTEETRGYFHGREEEVAELGRRVQRKLLTILFGQSGLGKTSILRAGIVPRLRPEGYCPVYVRIDYSPESPSPAEQIKQAIFRATRAIGQLDAGRASRPRASRSGSSCTTATTSSRTRTARPSSRCSSSTSSRRSSRSRRPTTRAGRAPRSSSRTSRTSWRTARPGRWRRGSRRDDSITERFDFGRADYRILIALREDYLAHLEGLKGAMPSITQNRMRLARMNGPAGARRGDEAGRQARLRGGGRGHRALHRRRLGAAQRGGRALAPVPHLPRAQQRAHRAGPRRDLRGPPRGLARHHPRRVLRARARGPAGRPCAR